MTEIYIPDRFRDRVVIDWGGSTVVELDRQRGLDLHTGPLHPTDLVWSGHDERERELDTAREEAYDSGHADGIEELDAAIDVAVATAKGDAEEAHQRGREEGYRDGEAAGMTTAYADATHIAAEVAAELTQAPEVTALLAMPGAAALLAEELTARMTARLAPPVEGAEQTS